MMWREILEFKDNIPARRHKPQRKHVVRRLDTSGKLITTCVSGRGSGKSYNRMVSAFTR